MSLFDKFMQGQNMEGESTMQEPHTLPNQFDLGRRTSVSAECWPDETDLLNSAAAAAARRWYQPNLAGDLTTGLGECNVAPSGSSAAVPSNGTSLEGISDASGVTSSISGKVSSTTAGLADEISGCPDQDMRTVLGARGISKSIIDKNAYARVAKALRSTIFFSELSDDLMQQLLPALRLRREGAGVTVIKQGDEGDELFVLDEGRVEFIRNGEHVGEATSGATLGELALLYNSQRAATVRTLEPCVMYTLDRITFKRIMVAKLSRKRVHSQQVLASIDVFAHLPESTQLRIADALHPVTYNRGDTVIKQGDSGSEFFVIDEGTVDISIDGKTLGSQGPGSYFGELALIYDLPRAATITATSEKLKVEVLSSRGFEQLIGPDLVAELRKRDPRSGQQA